MEFRRNHTNKTLTQETQNKLYDSSTAEKRINSQTEAITGLIPGNLSLLEKVEKDGTGIGHGMTNECKQEMRFTTAAYPGFAGHVYQVSYSFTLPQVLVTRNNKASVH
jgi:hypothetical protein